MLRRWLPILAIATVLLHGASGCISDGEDKLNPQPLPPGDPPTDRGPTQDGENSGAGPMPSLGDGGLSGDADAGTGADAASDAEGGPDA